MKTIHSLLITATVALTFSSIAAQADNFSHAACEQNYSYLGGYSIEVSALAKNTSTITLAISRHVGPDGDGTFQGTLTTNAFFIAAQSTPAISTYDSPFGTLSIDQNAGSAIFTDSSGVKNNLSCTFDFANSTAVDSTVADLSYPLNACAANLSKMETSLKTNDTRGNLFYGFASALYSEDAPSRAAIVLETTSQVYFYTEDCDIGATMYVCEKSSAQVSQFKTDHSLGCADLPAVSASDIVYSSCNAH